MCKIETYSKAFHRHWEYIVITKWTLFNTRERKSTYVFCPWNGKVNILYIVTVQVHVALLLFIKRTISPHCGVFNIFYIAPSLKCILLINLQPKTLIKKRVFFFQIRLICILLHVFLISLFINDLATNQIITHTETEYYLQQQQQNNSNTTITYKPWSSIPMIPMVTGVQSPSVTVNEVCSPVADESYHECALMVSIPEPIIIDPAYIASPVI